MSQKLATESFVTAYADAVAQGLDIKNSVVAATTGNITLSGVQTIDGYGTSVGERILVKNQTTGSENGIYVVASGAWSRSSDADSSSEVTAGMFTFVAQGTTNADTGWVLTTNDPITLGTTSLSFTQFSAAAQITAGTGLSFTGSTLNVNANADGSIIANADDIQVGVLASDAQHGLRGGGTQHSVATTSTAGFQSAADKLKQDNSPDAYKLTGTSTNGSTVNLDTSALAATSSFSINVDLLMSRTDAGGRARVSWTILAHSTGSALVIDQDTKVVEDANGQTYTYSITNTGLALRIQFVGTAGQTVDLKAFVTANVLGGA